MRDLLRRVCSDPETHGRFLNTLSYLENEGARAIAACEHPTIVKKEMLKHAAEEFRHAYYLKSQIPNIHPEGFPTYHLSSLLGGYSSLHYLRRLNIQVSRLVQGPSIREQAYVLVTYAIEVRARSLYPAYQAVLKEANLPVSVISIIREEEQHLAEMEQELTTIPNGQHLAKIACSYEQALHSDWIQALSLPIA